MRRWALLLLLLFTVGCPGQRRPPPAPPEPDPAPETDPDPEEPPPVVKDPIVLERTIAGLTDGIEDLRQERDAFAAQPADADAHAKLMERVDALQTLAFELQESDDDAVLDAVYPLLEELELIRDDVVRLEPE